MKQGIYAVVDLVAQQYYAALYLFGHEAAAVRMFRDAAADPGNAVGRHPADHNLMFLGGVDLVTGRIEVLDDPQVILPGAALVALNTSDKDM